MAIRPKLAWSPPMGSRYATPSATRRKDGGRLIAGVGGLFVGMISTGLGELNGYFLLQRCRVPSKVSVATSIFVVALTALSASPKPVTRY